MKDAKAKEKARKEQAALIAAAKASKKSVRLDAKLADICFDFTRGTCNRGDSCRFSHELPPSGVIPPGPRPWASASTSPRASASEGAPSRRVRASRPRSEPPRTPSFPDDPRRDRHPRSDFVPASSLVLPSTRAPSPLTSLLFPSLSAETRAGFRTTRRRWRRSPSARRGPPPPPFLVPWCFRNHSPSPPPTAPARTPPRAPLGGDWASIAASGTKNGEGYAAAARARGANGRRIGRFPPGGVRGGERPHRRGTLPHPSLGGNGTFRFGDGVDGGSNGVGGTPAASPSGVPAALPSRPNFSFGTGLSPASPAGPGVGVGAPSPLVSPLSSRVDFSTGGDGNGAGGGFGGGGVSPSLRRCPPSAGSPWAGRAAGEGSRRRRVPRFPRGLRRGWVPPGPASVAASSAVGHGLGAGVGAGAGAGAGSSPAAVGAGWGGGLGGGAFGGGGLGLFTGGASIFGGFGGGDVGGGLWSGTAAATEDERLRYPAGASPAAGGGGGLGAFGSTNGGNYGF